MAWTKTSKNGYIILSESALVLDDNESASAEVVTVTSVFPDGMNWEDTKFPVTVDMTTASGAAVVCDATLQTSTTGETSDDVMGASSATPSWVDSVDLNINVGSATTTNYSIECDATDVWAPYARIALDTAATDLTDGAGRCTISVAFKATNVPLEAADLANGVGADPS
jgi:hypothetical protein